MHRNAAVLSLALLTACAGGGGDDPTNGPRVVTGTVLGSDRAPLAGARVATRAAGGWRSTTTDARGGFSLQVDGVPYDLAVAQGDQVELYLGATRTDPQARLSAPGGGTASASFTTTIAGTCGGPACPPAGHEGSGQLTFATGTASWVGTARSPGLAGTYAASWPGPGAATGSIFALYWACPGSCASSAPDAFWLARQDAVTLAAGATSDLPPLALSSVPTSQLDVNVSAPQGAISSQAMIGVALGTPGVYWLKPAGSGAPGSHTFLVPVAQDLRTMVYLSASTGGGSSTTAFWSGATPPATPVDLSLRPVPVLVEPTDSAVFGAGTRFAWTSEPGAVHVLVLQPGASGQPEIHVTTAAQGVDLPDLTALGVTVLAGNPYLWSVRSQPSSVDGRLAPLSTTPIAASASGSSWSAQSAMRPATAR